MLLFFGIVAAIFAVALFVLISLANGMSDAPEGKGVSLWPAIALAVLSVLLLVLRHYLHGKSITW